MPTLREIEEYNRNHPLTALNAYLSIAVWTLGSVAVAATFLPAEMPLVRALPLTAGTHARVDHLIVQASLLMFFLNTQSVFKHYISRLEYGLLSRLSGSAVYAAHLAAVVWTLLHPYDWLLCMGGVLLVRLLVNWQLSVEVGLRTPDHPWRGLLRDWLGRSVLDAVAVLLFALLVETVSDFSLYTYLHGLRIGVGNSQLGQILVADVRTLMYMVACYQIGTHAARRKRVTSSFSEEEIRTQHRLLDDYYGSPAA